MVLERKRQGVISGSITWKNREYIEIFDRDYKYLYGEVEYLFVSEQILENGVDLIFWRFSWFVSVSPSFSTKFVFLRYKVRKFYSYFFQIAYGSWVEYDIIDASVGHPKNCFKEAINVNMDVKKSNAPTTDEFGKTEMKVRDFNKVDFFQYNTEGGQLTVWIETKKHWRCGHW